MLLRQLSLTSPPDHQPLSPRLLILPIKATLRILASSNLLTAPVTSLFPVTEPTTLIFSSVDFLNILPIGATLSAQGMFIFTLPKLKFLSVAPSASLNKGLSKL